MTFEDKDVSLPVENTQLSPMPSARKEPRSTKATKAYENKEFLHSRGARYVRIMCEYMETQSRLLHEGVLFSVLFFGSARGFSREEWDYEFHKANRKLSTMSPDDIKYEATVKKIAELKLHEWLCHYYEKGSQLSYKITEWADSEEAKTMMKRIAESGPSPVTSDVSEFYATQRRKSTDRTDYPPTLVVCTGAGPGLMEAANRGAQECPGGRSLGMGISLPMENVLNPYITNELAFQYHYFFTRKFWMVYIALALVVMPGGVGTLDELMEVLTLKQTGKIRRDIPIVLFGVEFWKKTINFEFLLECGTIGEEDLNSILYTDDVDEAFNFLRSTLLDENRMILKGGHKSHKYRVKR